MGGAYPCYGYALNSLIHCRIRIDGYVDGVRTMSTDQKTENLKYSPTYKECEMRYNQLLCEIEDIISPTFRENWFHQVRQLRSELHCWKHASELMKVAKRHDQGLQMNPILGLIRNNGYINKYINRCNYTGKVLSKGKQLI